MAQMTRASGICLLWMLAESWSSPWIQSKDDLLKEDEIQAIAKAQNLKLQLELAIRKVKVTTNLPKESIEQGEAPYISLKASHDVVIDLIVQQTILGKDQSKEVKAKSEELRKKADLVLKFVTDRKQDLKGFSTEALANAMVEAAAKILQAQSREKERQKEFLERIKAELEKMKLREWSVIQIIDPVSPWSTDKK